MFKQLDFQAFHSASLAERDAFCHELVMNLRLHGFARLINLDIPLSHIDSAFETSRHFFQLPLKQKLKSPHPPAANPHRGYSPFGLENVSAASKRSSDVSMPLLKDMKESYDIGSGNDQLYGNIWPPAGVYDEFERNFTSFFEVCYRAELVLLQAISIGLGLPAETLGQLHKDQSNELRLTHYPAVSRGDFEHSTRIAAHTDFGTITLLFQDDVGGLQMGSPPGSGNFVGIESGGRHECILNVGDCLQKWTGLHSALHRVHLPELPQEADAEPAGDVIPERYSMAYFAKPDRTASLRPLLDNLITEEGVEYMTANEFQHMRIQGTY